MIVYAITDPSILSFDTLQSDLHRISSKKANMIVYRDRNASDYNHNAYIFVKYARDKFEKVMVHGDVDLALELEADGVHLRSDQLQEIVRAKKEKLFVVVSTHTLEEIVYAQKSGADIVTLSPVFRSPGKGKPMGVQRFAEIVSRVEVSVLALGGISTERDIELCMEVGAAGFAAIRYFG